MALVTTKSAIPIVIDTRPIGTTSETLRSGLTSQWWIDVSTKASPTKPAPLPTTKRAHIRRNWASRSRAISVRGAW